MATKSAVSGATPFGGNKSVAAHSSANNPNHNNYRSHSVDSQMTSLSGGSDLTTASQRVSEDGIDNAIRIGPISLDKTDPVTAQYHHLGGKNKDTNTRNKNQNTAGGQALGGTGQVPVCTLCDAAASDFSCRACGGLTFCEKCALSLHTNKFLGNHTLQNILDPNDSVLGSDLAVRRATLDAEKAAREIYSDQARAARRQAEEESLQRTLRLAADSGREKAKEAAELQRIKDIQLAREGPKLDMKAIAADRSVLTARGKELRSCIDILRRLGMRLAEEQASCIDATRTAGDAIRKKFDLLRSLINQKEAQFLGVVQDAGKSRHEAAASQRTAVAAAVAETSAFVDNLELQLQRLDGNHTMFDEARAGLLEDTRLKISNVDGLIHKFEGVVQEVREIPLGVVVPVDGIVTALQMLQPPERTIGSSEVAMLNAAEALHPVPADSFENSLGVKHFRSGSSNVQLQQQLMKNNLVNNNNISNRSDSPTGARRVGGSGSEYSSRSLQVQRPKPFEIRETESNNNNRGLNSSIMTQQQQQRTSSPYSQRQVGSGMPAEVRELRRHLMSSSTGNNNNNNSTSVARVGGGSPLRTSSPLTNRNNTSSPIRRSGSPLTSQQALNNSYRGNPGPGSYHVSYPLSSKNGPLSTPPRRY
jgi:hypothetical protein